MHKLIDADVLIQGLMVDPLDCPGCPEPDFLNDFVAILKAAPPVDAIPVSWIKEQAKKRDKVVASILMLTVQEWKENGDGNDRPD